MLKSKYKLGLNPKLTFGFAFLLISFILMLSSYFYPLHFARVREKGYFVADFFYAVSSGMKEAVGGFFFVLMEAKKIKEENQILRRKLEELIFKEENYYRQLEIENRRLYKLLELKEKSSYRLICARIVAYPPDEFFRVVYIDKGKKEGVKEKMPVVNARGLVGKVVEVYPDSAKVMLLVDRRFKVGVRVERTGDIGILQGTGNPEVCNLNYILNLAEPEVGDRVVTSGLGGVFPSGIGVGFILKIEKKPNYIFQQIEVKPAVDFGKIEEVFIMVGEK